VTARPSRRVVTAAAAGAIALALLVWILFWALPRWTARDGATATPAGSAAAGEGRRITATLFFIAPDAQALVAVSREVPYGATPADQARLIIEAQLGEAPSSHFSAMPAGTTLRAVFVSETGEAFVDLSPEASANHSGGSLAALFTVSLPAVSAVQILVDGREVETLAGHVDLRHPLPKNTTWVKPQ
jgi:hypothetical protein